MANYQNHNISKLENKLNHINKQVQSHLITQETFLLDVRELNNFVADELENNKNHNLRKEECKEKVDELKNRVLNVKEKLNSARNVLVKLINNKNIKSLVNK